MFLQNLIKKQKNHRLQTKPQEIKETKIQRNKVKSMNQQQNKSMVQLKIQKSNLRMVKKMNEIL